MRFSLDSLFGNPFRKCPSPFGTGWRGAPGEGWKSTPHPALRATFSQREKDTSLHFG